MNKIFILWVDKEYQKFNTTGYWETRHPKTWENGETDNDIAIAVNRLPDWRYQISVTFHELIELCWCKLHGVTTKECDDFDEIYEELYRSGKIPQTKDPGDDKKCPYYRGHQWGKLFERIVCFILKVKWKEYVKSCREN
jgi:hypothetical protein